MGVTARLDRLVARLGVFDARHSRKSRDSALEADREPASSLGRWREPPFFRWGHTWTIGDGVAAILAVGGLIQAGRSISHTAFVDGLGWLAVCAGGVGLFARISLLVDD